MLGLSGRDPFGTEDLIKTDISQRKATLSRKVLSLK